MKQVIMTAGQAQRIITSRPVIDTTAPVSGVQVNNVAYKDKEGHNFQWKDATTGELLLDDEGNPRNYAIVNLNATNPWGAVEAVKLHKEGEYQKSVNTNLSLRVTPEEGRAIEAAGEGTLSMHTITKDNGEERFLPRRFKAAKAVEVSSMRKVSFEGVSAQATEKTPDLKDA